MNEKVNNIKINSCNICDKVYASKSSLCNHNKKFHSENNKNSPQMIDVSPVKIVKSPNYDCRYCNKEYNNKNSRWSHEQKCKNIIKEMSLLDTMREATKQKQIDLELKKEEAAILRLKIKLAQSDKVENVTLKQLNKRLIQRNNLIKNSTVNSNNTITNVQNNIVNNFQLVGFGKEEVVETLTNHEMKLIMNAKYSSIDKLIEIVHCGKYSQFKNIIITNMKDNYMYKYDDKVGHFILSTKIDIINSLIGYRLGDLEIIYNDLLEKNKLDEKTKDIIEKFINKINNDESKYTDYDGKEHENYKQYKINEIKILLFNNQDKITNDISLLLTTDEVTTDLII